MSAGDDKFYDTLVATMHDILQDRGNVVYLWPDDEAEAYRDAGGFSEGREAVTAIRARKAADMVMELLKGQENG